MSVLCFGHSPMSRDASNSGAKRARAAVLARAKMDNMVSSRSGTWVTDRDAGSLCSTAHGGSLDFQSKE